MAIIQKEPLRGVLTKGLFHALRRMKEDFSLLFQALYGHEKLHNWSLWPGYSEKKKVALKRSCRAEIRLGVSLCLGNLPVFSVSADPERILTNLGY